MWSKLEASRMSESLSAETARTIVAIRVETNCNIPFYRRTVRVHRLVNVTRDFRNITTCNYLFMNHRDRNFTFRVSYQNGKPTDGRMEKVSP